jgi:hypothetical protein
MPRAAVTTRSRSLEWGLDHVSYAVDTWLIALGEETLTQTLGGEGFLSQYDDISIQSTTPVHST